jgi:DNA polymerase-3 subunit alpha
MGKKIPAEMEAQKEKLIKGFIEYGKLGAEKAEKIWKLIEPFAAYGFNKAHAACYGKVAYQTAYMKANYPVEYMAALLTADSGDTDQIAILVAEASRLNIPVLPPDINESRATFTVVMENGAPSAIRFGLSSIKNFGEGISEAIIAERENAGPFASLSDFLSRVGSKNLNRKSLESLIKCGALDSLAEEFGGRGALLTHIEALLDFHRGATAPAAQDSLFGGMMAAPKLSLPKADGDVSLKDKLEWERELLGIYVSGHPLDAHAATSAKASLDIAKIKADPKPGLSVILPVLVSDVRTILTKGGEKMAFVKFEDRTDSIESVMFPKLYKEHSALLVPGACLLVKATVSSRNNELSLAIDKVKAL